MKCCWMLLRCKGSRDKPINHPLARSKASPRPDPTSRISPLHRPQSASLIDLLGSCRRSKCVLSTNVKRISSEHSLGLTHSVSSASRPKDSFGLTHSYDTSRASPDLTPRRAPIALSADPSVRSGHRYIRFIFPKLTHPRTHEQALHIFIRFD